MQKSEIRDQRSDKDKGKELSILFLADVQCSWCGKITGKKIMNADNEYSQEMIREDGRLVTHGICMECIPDLVGDALRSECPAQFYIDNGKSMESSYINQLVA